MPESDNNPIVGRRIVQQLNDLDAKPVPPFTIPGETHIVTRRKVFFKESPSKNEISMAEKLPPELQKIVDEITPNAPESWRQQAIQAAYFIWSLDLGKTITDVNGQSLEKERQKFVDQLATTGFVRGVYGRPARWSIDPSKSLPSWLYAKNNFPFERVSETDLQQVKIFYDAYVAARAKEHRTPDGQRYFDYEEGVPQKEVTSFAGTHRSKGYVEGIHLRDINKLEKVLSQLRSLNLHPHATKLFDGDRLVLYWDSKLSDEQRSAIENSFADIGVKIRAFAQDVPRVDVSENGYKVDVRESNDASLGEGGRNPFDWEEAQYNAAKFLEKYLQLTYWGCKDPSEPYKLSFVPIILAYDAKPDLVKEQVLEIQKKIAENDHLPTVVNEGGYLNCFAK